MTVLLENAYELESIACEIGAIHLKGHPRYPSETGGWQLGELDLDEYLAKFRDRKLVLIIAPISDVEPASVTCGICGFVMNEVGECPRCKLELAERVGVLARRSRGRLRARPAALAADACGQERPAH